MGKVGTFFPQSTDYAHDAVYFSINLFVLFSYDFYPGIAAYVLFNGFQSWLCVFTTGAVSTAFFQEEVFFKPESIYIYNGRIVSRETYLAASGTETLSDAASGYVIPGLTDIHFHDCIESDCCDGTTEAFCTIAGSVTNLMDCMHTAVRDTGIPLISAVKCAAVNPAKAIGLFHEYGSLTPGKYANVVVLDQDLKLKRYFTTNKISAPSFPEDSSHL